MHCGTVTAAARALHITQPAVTRLLHSLEDQVGFPLFERISGRLVPTDEGRAFFYEVDKAFIGLEQLEKSAKTIRERPSGIFHIASMPMLSLSFIPEVIGKMDNRALKTLLRNYRSDQVLQVIEVGGCDLGFAILEEAKGINAECLRFEGDMCCLLPENSCLHDLPVIYPEHLNNCPLVCYEHAEPQAMIDQVFEQQGVTYKPAAEASFAMSVGSLVAAGVGHGIVDPFTAIHFSRFGLSFKPFKPALPFHFDILFPAGYPLSSSASSFLKLFFKTVKDEGICYQLVPVSHGNLIEKVLVELDQYM